MTTYNSKAYYVQGAVSAPGRMCVTGNDTVLDAINYAGGLLATADRRDIRLVRQGRPKRVLPVDLDGIVKRGDPSTNYQLFPGDRLLVGAARRDLAADPSRRRQIEERIDRAIRELEALKRELGDLPAEASSDAPRTLKPIPPADLERPGL